MLHGTISDWLIIFTEKKKFFERSQMEYREVNWWLLDPRTGAV